MDEIRYKLRDELIERLDNDFSYHPPIGTQAARYEKIRAMAHDFVLAAAVMCPESRELSIAITHVETAVFFMNAAIARNETDKVF